MVVVKYTAMNRVEAKAPRRPASTAPVRRSALKPGTGWLGISPRASPPAMRQSSSTAKQACR